MTVAEFNKFAGQAHPNAQYLDEYEDLCYLMQIIAQELGHGEWDNGGEFEPDKTQAVEGCRDAFTFTYRLDNDDCSEELRITAIGQIGPKGDFIDITHLRGVERLPAGSYASELPPARPQVDVRRDLEGSCGRIHEECYGCALQTVEPPQCKGHPQGPVACSEFSLPQEKELPQ